MNADSPAQHSQQPRRFLVADSDPERLAEVSQYVRKAGAVHLHEANNGAEGFSSLKQHGADMIVAGWDMPEINGLGLLKVTRADAKFSRVPFLLMATEVTKAQVIEAAEAGVHGILIAPFNERSFLAKLEEVSRVGQEPTDLEAKRLAQQGETLMRQERWGEAVQCFQKVLTVYENAEVYYNMGYIKTAQGKYEDALRCFAKATTINNAFAEAYQKMGECYLQLGQKRYAQASLQRAADIYSDKKMDGNAEQVLKEVLKINPDTINVYNSLGILYRRQGKYDLAIKQYKKALRVNSTDENILYNLARTYYEAGEFDQAKTVLNRALSLNPGFSHGQELLMAVNKSLLR
jgi:tetratricopeptide (TPR) repeat protein